MSPEAEKYLWDRLPFAGTPGKFPRDTIAEMVDHGMIKSPKQAWATLDKWADKGLYNYGVSLDLGWREK